VKVLVESPYLRFKHAGGSVFPSTLARGLVQSGYEVTLLGLTLDVNKEKIIEKKVVNKTKDESLIIRWLKDPVQRGDGKYPLYDGFAKNNTFKNKYEKLIKDVNPDIIIVNSFNRSGPLIKFAQEKNIPVLYIACDLGSTCLNEVGLYEISDERCPGPDKKKCTECQISQFTWFRFLLSRIALIFIGRKRYK
tara:strand:- start:186 stop:761 length:576 start_codon:yes stop_codon:yes gene_type:complete